MFKKSTILALTLSNLLFALGVPENKVVDTSWLKENISDPNIVIIDMRESKADSYIPNSIPWSVSEFRESRNNIPGFIGSPMMFEELAQKSGITQDSAIIFYTEGNSDTDYTAATLAVHISEFYGLENVAILNGGYAAWIKDGGKTDKNKANPKKTDFHISNINPNEVATVYDIDDAVTTNDWVLMDGRSKAQFTGKDIHPKAAKAGHLKGANNLFIASFVKNKDGVFYINTDKDDVSKLINSAGGDITKPTLWYCNTGWFASGGWFISKYITKISKVKVYDGSMVEYTSLPKREVLKSE